MDFKIIRQLVKLVEESNITALNVQEGELKIEITKSAALPSQQLMQPVQIPVQQSIPVPQVNMVDAKPLEKKEPSVSDNERIVKSPIVGTFYRAPSPDAKPFVEEGHSVSKGQTMCIIEAMKVMNEIESEYNGIIKKILIQNAQPVEYGQDIFIIEVS
ncbi:MAG: acetyl-CoA carboxylase biotin carboxyl carrier protein [Candidatus Coatesbacteria bacterium]|nr:acetyl-CoA carboxylase biotin carboxyl carrier protein [Candidatus Coatesbacteria bacterium]